MQDNAIGYDLIDILEWGFDDKGQLQSIVYIGYSIDDEETYIKSTISESDFVDKNPDTEYEVFQDNEKEIDSLYLKSNDLEILQSILS